MRNLLFVVSILPAFAAPFQSARLPVHFEPTADGSSFMTRAGHLTVHVSADGAEFRLGGADAVKMTLAGAQRARLSGVDRLPGVTNYYLGSDPRKWRERVPNFARVRAQGIYPGIDLVYYSSEGCVEYDFVVAPGADASRIAISFAGADSVSIAGSGDVLLRTAAGDIVHHKPKVYQTMGGSKVEVEAAYRLDASGRVTLALGGYDPSQPLVIDPVVSWATFHSTTTSGNTFQEVKDVMLDAAGNVILAGHASLGTNLELFLSKLNATGTAHLFTTFLGGAGFDRMEAATTDSAGNIVVAGATFSSDFPISSGVFASPGTVGDAALASFDAAGALRFSTRFGGQSNMNESAYGIATDAANAIFVAGSAGNDFPVMGGLAAGGTGGAFAVKLTSAGVRVFSTLIGGTPGDIAYAIAADATGVYVAGRTGAFDFPVRGNSYGYRGQGDGFLTKLNPQGNDLIYSTYFGSTLSDTVTALRVNASGEAFIAGIGGETPVTSGSFGTDPFPPELLPPLPASIPMLGFFVAKFNAAGTALVYGGRIGPTLGASAFVESLAIDAAGAATIAGTTTWPDLPVVAASQWSYAGRADAFAIRVSPPGDRLLYSTYLGGSDAENGGAVALDAAGNAVVAGSTGSANFPVTPGTLAGMPLFVAKLGPGQAPFVNVAFNTVPSGLHVRVDGTDYTTPKTLRLSPGSMHTIEADAQGFVDGASSAHLWTAWTPAGSGQRAQTITIPNTDATYTAQYAAQTGCTFAVSPASVLTLANSWQVDVTAPPGCFWTALSATRGVFSSVGWRTGNGSVSFSVVPNFPVDTASTNVAFRHLPVRLIRAPVITSPAPGLGEVSNVAGVTIRWLPQPWAEGYRISISEQPGGRPVFSGTLTGNQSDSMLVTLPNGEYSASLASCIGPSLSQCSVDRSGVSFLVALTAPANPPGILFPFAGSTLTSSTQTLRWSSVANAQHYEVELDNAAGAPELRISSTTGDTTFSMHSGSYRMRVRACQAGCGPWSPTITFTVNLPPVPTAAPANFTCQPVVTNRLSCSWNVVTGADLYVLQAVQAGVGPGGGALTVASNRGTATSVANLPVPVHPGGQPTEIIVAACNGNGCGPNTGNVVANGTRQTVPGPNPSSPFLASPIPGSIVAGPVVLLAWNRIDTDNGSNTTYRLFALDFSRQTTALDVYTKQNFWGAYFRAEGSRYDALVFAAPPNGNPGNAAPFNVSGGSPVSPTLVMPRHQDAGVTDTIPAGNVLLGWTPVPGATLYEYYVGVPGSSNPAARGVSTGLSVQVPLPAGLYDGIVRACPAGQTCSEGSANWGPWSNQGGSGVTKFRVQ